MSRPELPLNGVTRGPQALPVVSAAAAGDGHVTIDDLAGALASALSGCAPVAAAATGAMPAGAAPSA